MITPKSLLIKARLIRSVPLLNFVTAFGIAVAIYFNSENLSPEERATVSVAGFMVAAWAFEAIPFGAVALIPAVAFPLLNI